MRKCGRTGEQKRQEFSFMLRPITYTYKGRPLAPFGIQKSARTLRRRRALRSAVLTILCCLVFLGIIAASVWWFSSCSRSEPPSGETAGTERTVPSDEFADAQDADVPEQPGPSSADTLRHPEQAPVQLTESVDRQALQIYTAAASAFQKKEYEKARRALRLFFEKLKVPPGHPLYDRACTILSDSSLAIYRSGNDPADWTVHKVERGESLSRIARKYGTDVATITAANQLTGTALRIGQTLRIPGGSWRIRIERKNRRLLLDGNGRLFKIYPLVIGPRGESASAGLYRIRRQQTPARILFYGPSASAASAAIQSSGEGDPEPGRVCFSLSPGDLAELLLLIPEKTPAEILK